MTRTLPLHPVERSLLLGLRHTVSFKLWLLGHEEPASLRRGDQELAQALACSLEEVRRGLEELRTSGLLWMLGQQDPEDDPTPPRPPGHRPKKREVPTTQGDPQRSSGAEGSAEPTKAPSGLLPRDFYQVQPDGSGRFCAALATPWCTIEPGHRALAKKAFAAQSFGEQTGCPTAGAWLHCAPGLCASSLPPTTPPAPSHPLASASSTTSTSPLALSHAAEPILATAVEVTSAPSSAPVTASAPATAPETVPALVVAPVVAASAAAASEDQVDQTCLLELLQDMSHESSPRPQNTVHGSNQRAPVCAGARLRGRANSQCQGQRDPSYIGLGTGNGRASASPVITPAPPASHSPQTQDVPSSQHSAPQAAAKAKANADKEEEQLAFLVERAASLQGKPDAWSPRAVKEARNNLTLWWQRLRREGITWGVAPGWKQPQRGAKGKKYPSVENMLRSIGAPPHAALVVLLLVVWQSRPRHGSMQRSGPGLFRHMLEEQLKLARSTGSCDLDGWPFAPTFEDLLVCWNQGAEPEGILQERLALAHQGAQELHQQDHRPQHHTPPQTAPTVAPKVVVVDDDTHTDRTQAPPCAAQPPPPETRAQELQESRELTHNQARPHQEQSQRTTEALRLQGEAPDREGLADLKNLIDMQLTAEFAKENSARKAHKRASSGSVALGPASQNNPAGHQERAPGLIVERPGPGAAHGAPGPNAKEIPLLARAGPPPPSSPWEKEVQSKLRLYIQRLREGGLGRWADSIQDNLRRAQSIIGVEARAKALKAALETAKELLKEAKIPPERIA